MVPCFPLLGLTPSGLFMGLSSTIIYTSELFPRFGLPFVLDTDASTIGVAAVLSQVQDGKERPIAYAAKALSKSQRKWAPTKIEMYALVFGTESFYPYLIS